MISELELPLPQSNDQIFEEALKKGYVLLNISKVVTSGAAGSGKTCTKYVLLGEKPPMVRTSTALFDVSRMFRDVSRELVATDKLARWFLVSYSHLNEIIARAIKKGVSHEVVQFEEISIADESEFVHKLKTVTNNFPAERKKSTMQHQETTVVNKSDLPITTTSNFSTKMKQPVPVHLTKGSEITSGCTTREDILQLMEEHAGSDELMRLHWIYFVDSGGQPQFYDLLPAFVKNKSVILLVTKLSERLDEYPTIQYFRNGRKYKEYVSRSSNEQILQHYCRTLVSNNQNCCVLIVGTHRDCPCEESIEKKDKIIANLLKSSLKSRLVEQCSQDGKVLYPLNAQNPSQEDFRMAALIRKEITKENCTQQFKVPIAWFLLEQDIQQKGNLKGIISLQDCIQLASQLKMNHQALLAALEYFDKLSILLYFPSALPNVVFTNSQVIIDKVTEIVNHSYYLRSLEEENSERQQWPNFLNFGIISRELLLKQFPTHYMPKLFTVDDLFELFQHLLIIAQLNCNEFVMPAILPEITAEDLDSLEPSLMSLTPILIYFPDGCAPGGAFCCLSVYLISECGWKIADTFYRNCLKFHVGSITVTLIDSFHYFKVYLEDPNVISPFSICKWVLASISTGLSKACLALNYDAINHNISILCPCKREKHEHAATLDKQFMYWACTKFTNIKGKVSEKFTPWHHLQNQVEFPTDTSYRQSWRKAHRKDHYKIDQGSYLRTVGLLLALSILVVGIHTAKYRFYFPAWSTQYPTTSGGHQGHAVVPPVMPKFHLPGMQLLSIETYSLHDNTQPHTIAWNKFGFKLYIPPGAFHEKTLNITVGVTLSGNFKFPANSTLVSAVYYVEASSKLFRPVTIEMEHCLMSKDEDDFRELSFLVAEVHPGFPHYTFQAVRWGIFSPASSWGSIQVSSFSLFSIISWITDLFKTPPIGYSAQIYQMKVSQIVFNVRLVVTRHLSSCKEAVQTRYCEEPWNLKKDFHFHFVNNSEQVLSLEIADTGFDTNGWWIKPSSPPPEIHQMNIDGYGAASTPYDPAHCELTIWWTDKSTAPQSLLRDIKMKGVSKRSFEIMLSVSDLEGKGPAPIVGHEPIPCEVHITNPTEVSEVLPLLQAVKDIGDWFMLCKSLKVEESKLNLLKESSRDTEITKKTECLEAYINSGRASWEEVTKVVAQYPIANPRVAKKIANNYLEGVNKDKILKSLEECTATALNIIVVQ